MVEFECVLQKRRQLPPDPRHDAPTLCSKKPVPASPDHSARSFGQTRPPGKPRRAGWLPFTPPFTEPKAGAQDPNKTAGGIEIAGKVVAETDPQALLIPAYRRKLSMVLN